MTFRHQFGKPVRIVLIDALEKLKKHLHRIHLAVALGAHDSLSRRVFVLRSNNVPT
jgi:hypothetical protein